MKLVHPFQRRVLHYIHQEHLVTAADSILVAVSGGPDSVALLHVLVTIQELCGITRMAVLHFDHQLRHEASSADKAFVEALAAEFDLPFYASSADVHSYHLRHHISLEMAARVCRHRFFRDALTHFGARAVALGHNANDQAEELLLRLIRGTGPAGMRGMLPRTTSQLIRPLLFAVRTEILAYLRDQRLSFREDSSNLDPAHQRNTVRQKIFPLLQKHFHRRVAQVFCRHARLVDEEETFWTELLAKQWQVVCVAETAFRIGLHRQHLLDLHPALQRRLLRLAIERLKGNLLGIYTIHIEALCKLLAHRAPGKLIQLPHGLQAVREGEFLILSKSIRESPPPPEPDLPQTINGPGHYQFLSFELRLYLKNVSPSGAPGPFPDTSETIWIDAGRLQWPLHLRSWHEGDRFHPLGLGGSKKLQDFYGDLKIPRRDRGRVLLLCDQEKICWVVGYRLDDRVKVTPQTEHLLIIEKLNTT